MPSELTVITEEWTVTTEVAFMASGVFRGGGKGCNTPYAHRGVLPPPSEIIKNSNDDQGSFYYLYIENETRGR